MKEFELTIGLVVLIALAYFFCSDSGSKAPSTYKIGNTFKPVSLTDVRGEVISFETFRGKILFINFFASW